MYIVFGFKKHDYAGSPFTRLRTSDYIILFIVSLQSYIYTYHRIQRNIAAAMLHSRSSPESVARRTTAVRGSTVIVGVSTIAAVETCIYFILFIFRCHKLLK